MKSCWEKDPDKRPSFHHLKQLFGQMYTTEVDKYHSGSYDVMSNF